MRSEDEEKTKRWRSACREAYARNPMSLSRQEARDDACVPHPLTAAASRLSAEREVGA